jgi:hypothetical protein
MGRPIEDIEAELRQARAARDAEQKAKREATPVLRRFTILPATPRGFSEEMFDDSCMLYELRSEVTNKEEAKAAGHPEHDFREGGATYVFNKLSGKIVCMTGGGMVWISSGWKEDHKESAQHAMPKISALIVNNPRGGDITDIVSEHRDREH